MQYCYSYWGMDIPPGICVQTYPIELQITNATDLNPKFNNETNFLDDKHVVAVETYTIDDIGNAPSGNPIISNEVFKNMFLVLNDTNNVNIEQQVPAADFNRVLNNGRPYTLYYPVLRWPNSSVLFAQGTVLTVNTSAFFLVHYLTPQNLSSLNPNNAVSQALWGDEIATGNNVSAAVGRRRIYAR
jgi:hypothetical protein